MNYKCGFLNSDPDFIYAFNCNYTMHFIRCGQVLLSAGIDTPSAAVDS